MNGTEVNPHLLKGFATTFPIVSWTLNQ
jgi:hypothetical protein